MYCGCLTLLAVSLQSDADGSDDDHHHPTRASARVAPADTPAVTDSHVESPNGAPSGSSAPRRQRRPPPPPTLSSFARSMCVDALCPSVIAHSQGLFPCCCPTRVPWTVYAMRYTLQCVCAIAFQLVSTCTFVAVLSKYARFGDAQWYVPVLL